DGSTLLDETRAALNEFSFLAQIREEWQVFVQKKGPYQISLASFFQSLLLVSLLHCWAVLGATLREVLLRILPCAMKELILECHNLMKQFDVLKSFMFDRGVAQHMKIIVMPRIPKR
ncbi:MAG: hypothetical protein XD94_1857, partial [Mesotoga prima]